MTILFAYDGSESADAAIAAAGKLFDHDRADAVVLTGGLLKRRKHGRRSSS